MSDELLPFFDRERTFLNQLISEFSDQHKKVASRLRLNVTGGEDPHVQRIIDAFSLLNARIQYKLDDDFPEIIESLMGVLYPHYEHPIPSMSVVQFQPDATKAAAGKPKVVDRGTPLHISKVGIDGEQCDYRTCYDTSVWPFGVHAAQLAVPPWPFPVPAAGKPAQAVLKLELRTFNPDLNFSKCEIGSLRFYLHATHGASALALYQLLFNHTVEIVVASSANDPQPVVLPKSSLAPAGFASHEAALPQSARSFPGYRLLTEYFNFPQKFLFFDIRGLNPATLAHIDNRLEIYFFFNEALPKLSAGVSKENFRLGCTPVINLLEGQTLEAFELDQRHSEYHLKLDSRRKSALEIYAVESVWATTREGDQVEYLPFYGLHHGNGRNAHQTYWKTARRPSDQAGLTGDRGTEVYLSLTDLGFNPLRKSKDRVVVTAALLNRDLPSEIVFGNGSPKFELSEGNAAIAAIHCLTAPTRTIRPPARKGHQWRLLSHLTLNQLSLTAADDKAEALREILKLYDLQDDRRTRELIDAILKVSIEPEVGRYAAPVEDRWSAGESGAASPPGRKPRTVAEASGLCQGMKVSIHIDESNFSDNEGYLLATVLDRFLALYTSINSFTRLVVTSDQRSNQGEIWKWPARAGEKVLL